MISASLLHLDQARIFEARGQLEEALREYRRASEFDPPNRQMAAKVLEIERRIRDQVEAAQPRTSMQQMRDTARQSGPPPLFNLTTVLRGSASTTRTCATSSTSIGMSTGINVTYDNTFQDRTYTVQLDDVTLEEALNQILTANQLFYKVVNQRTIMVIPDNPQKRAQYDEQVIRTFFISHADATELAQIINTVIRVGGGRCSRWSRQQDGEHHHRARHHQCRGDHRADDRVERQAARRGGHRRADSRGEPEAGEAVRPRPRYLLDQCRVLAGGGRAHRRGQARGRGPEPARPVTRL